MKKSVDIQQSVFNEKISSGALIKFALPTIISMVLMSIFTAIDGVFISNFVNMEALATINLVVPLGVIISANIR